MLKFFGDRMQLTQGTFGIEVREVLANDTVGDGEATAAFWS